MKKLPLIGSLGLSLAIAGCAGMGDRNDDDTAQTPDLNGTVWQVEDVDNGGIIDNSMITVAFADGQVTGFTGCNRYFGTYETVGSSLTVRGLGNSRKACPPAIMAQEQRFLKGLISATSYQVESDTWLIIIDDKEQPRLKMIEIDKDPTATNPASGQPQDTSAAKQSAQFSCPETGPVAIQFVGPETLAVDVDGRSETLQRVPSASGTHYVGDTLTFRNQGPSGMLTMDGNEYKCTRID